jgi:zinc/manganese transport system substrate-binding protein
MSRRTIALSAAMAAMAIGVASCSTSPRLASAPGPDGGKTVTVGASINAWGSILSQLGGRHVRETSIITNPNTDPHDYEPTPADGRTIATSQLFVENGVGYDSWAAKALQAGADPHRVVVDVGRVTGTPEGGNPHRWYSPTDVAKVAARITADLKKVDPADAAYFQGRYRTFQTTALAPYHRLIHDIKARYAGTPVGASESIFAPLAGALGLRLVTPPSFLKAISEGTDPSAADKATIDAQISGKKIKVYVFNSQNSTPDVSEQVSAARKAGIPVTQITETLSPAGATFQQWQATQLRSLERALSQASGT